MAGWDTTVALDPADPRPTFVQISQTLADDVRRGRLRPGDRLPSSRRLAETLGVHRNTVLAAYAELTAEGWICSERARGTFVSEALPDLRPRQLSPTGSTSVAARAGFELGRAVAVERPPQVDDGVIALTGGLPDVSLAPGAALARAYRRAVQRRGQQMLDYGSPAGELRLRTALRAMLAATRGVVGTEDEILVTRGSQMALYLIAQTLVSPGDVIAVESYGYRPAWEAFKLAGADLHPLPVDDEGLVVDELRALAQRRRVRAVYVTPHHQYPTTVTLSAARRLQLMALAKEHRMAVIEDDYDHEFHYEGRPVLPLASADAAGVVVYVGTLSKVFAPGLRVGYVVAPAPVIERLRGYRAYVDHHGDRVGEVALAELIEDGELQRHTNRARRAYGRRRDAFVQLLRHELSDALTLSAPPGGMALWARVAKGIDANAWAARALQAGVAVSPGSRFAFDRRNRPFLRLGFARVQEPLLRRAVKVLAQTMIVR